MSEIYVEHVSNVHDSVLANSRKQNDFSCIVNGIGASEKIETTRLTKCTLAPHTIQHIIEDCTSHNLIRQQHNIHSRRTMWESPVQTADFLRSSGLLIQRA